MDRIDELVELLNEANYNYHVLDNPTITDQEYDKYLRELIDLEDEYNYVRDDSPTQRVGGEVLDGFEKHTHKIPMMSLSNVFNEEEIRDFDSKIKKEGINPQYVCELKIDGLSVSLNYENGKFEIIGNRPFYIFEEGNMISYNVNQDRLTKFLKLNSNTDLR